MPVTFTSSSSTSDSLPSKSLQLRPHAFCTFWSFNRERARSETVTMCEALKVFAALPAPVALLPGAGEAIDLRAARNSRACVVSTHTKRARCPARQAAFNLFRIATSAPPRGGTCKAILPCEIVARASVSSSVVVHVKAFMGFSIRFVQDEALCPQSSPASCAFAVLCPACPRVASAHSILEYARR